MELRRGDLIEVRWLDITEDPVGNPSEAKLPTRHSVGYFWGAQTGTFTTTMTMDDDVEDQAGYCIYPLGVIIGIKRIRKTRKRGTEPVRLEQRGRAGAFNLASDSDVLPPEAVGVGSGEPCSDGNCTLHSDGT